ncbi:putative LPLAT superfamily acyltransferase [Alteromonadaceae bacterium 2753L.S.0a.02]|nr:putative LPLAT superfamily acyltransferase [Alteromonadaceae bacterium 2753L.S.0a.02]
MTQSQPWYQRDERGSTLGMTIVVWVALRLGRTVVRGLLAFIVFYYTLFFASARHASRRFLKKVLPGPIGFWQIYRHFFYFAQTTVDRLFFLSNRWDYFAIDICGRENIEAQLEQGKGCLLLMSHFGSFDIIRAIGREQKNVRAKVLMDRAYAEKVMSLLDAVNPEMADDIIDVEQPPAQLMLKLQEVLGSGDLIGIMADRVHKSERVTIQEFLGGQVQFPAGLWQMAAALKIPVLACFGVYQGTASGTAKYTIFFESIADSSTLSRAERATWIVNAQRNYVVALESKARAHPYNWFNFYDYWVPNGTEN